MHSRLRRPLGLPAHVILLLLRSGEHLPAIVRPPWRMLPDAEVFRLKPHLLGHRELRCVEFTRIATPRSVIGPSRGSMHCASGRVRMSFSRIENSDVPLYTSNIALRGPSPDGLPAL